MELPREFKGTIYFYYNVKLDYLCMVDVESMPNEYVPLGSMHVEKVFDVQVDDAVNKVIDFLKKEKNDVQAKAQREIDRIDSRINELLAITYQGDDK